MTLLRNVSRLRSMPRRALATDATPPLMWKLAHGMFDSETSMTDKMPGVPDPNPIEAPTASAPQKTTLSNGVRVVSQDLGGPVSSLALFVGAGSRHENPMTSGSTFMIERLAYKRSAKRSKFVMTRDMERTGAIYSAAAARESIAFAAEGLRQNVSDIAPIVLESATAPLAEVGQYGEIEFDLAADEIKTHANYIKEDLKNITKDPNTVVTEAMHNVAFHGNTLGLPLIPTEDKLEAFSQETLHSFASMNFTPDRMILSASNYDHDALVDIAEAQLGSLSGTSAEHVSSARYTGGGHKVAASGPAHVAIGFEGISWQDDNLVPICVLHTLLGGGGSFSSGGPGKGMYTRLYSQVLNKHLWVTSAMAFNHCYSDSGIFGVMASCDDAMQLNALVEVVGTQIGRMAGPLNPGELARAKAMTKSSLITNLESRAVVCEDLGRQMLSSNKYLGPDELVKSIDAVTEDDIRRVAAQVVSSTPSVVTYGEEFETQDYTAIESAIKAQAKIAA